MAVTDLSRSNPLLLMVAGATGAVGSTVAVAAATLRSQPEVVLPSLMTVDMFPYLGPPQAVDVAGWDTADRTLVEAVEANGILPEHLWGPHVGELEQIQVWKPPLANLDLEGQVEKLTQDIEKLKGLYPDARAVLVNLLPAGGTGELSTCQSLSELYSEADPRGFPDLSYTIAAIRSGVPVVNFTPNEVEVPVVVHEAIKRGVPISGRDGKTGQTYLKVLLASALKARSLVVDGWYSLNILGNEDGLNLMDPEKATGKLSHKTEILDDILGYPVGERYGLSTHKVQIDYYPPRGDAKEAWDVIDFQGLFGLPMSIRLNLQARDSVLAAPMILDLARWMAALQMAGRSGPVSELGFYYKKPVGDDPPLTFQGQMAKLQELELAVNEKVAALRQAHDQ
jgi:myo-inositol-1-phosphate synthase